MTVGVVNVSVDDVGAERGADTSCLRQDGGYLSNISMSNLTIHMMNDRHHQRNFNARKTHLENLIELSPSHKPERLSAVSFQYLLSGGFRTVRFLEQAPETSKNMEFVEVHEPDNLSEATSRTWA